MPPFLPGDLKVTIKERLRDARFVMREMRPQPPRTIEGEIVAPDGLASVAGLTRAVAEVTDSALQTIETMAIGLLSSDARDHFGEARVSSLDRIFGARKTAAQAQFARESYFAAKQILRALGHANARLSEELFAAAHRRAARDGLTERWRAGGAGSKMLDAVAEDAAALALAIVSVKPVQAPVYLEAVGTSPRNANVYVASAIGLAAGVVTHHGDALASDEPVYASVCAAVEARYHLIEAAIAAPDANVALASVFAGLVPHLP